MPLLLYVHVLLAIAAFGTNLTYRPILRAGERDPEHLRFAIQLVRRLDRVIANPSYVLLAVTGVALAIVEGISFERGWLALAIGLYVVVAVLGIAVYAPATRRQVTALEEFGASDVRYRGAASRSSAIGLVVTLIVLVIVFLMVVKPF